MTRTLVASALVVCASINSAAADKPKPVAVFVTTNGAVGGFTDPNKDKVDTAKDLVGWLKGDRRITIVARREDATIVLTVTGRERQTGGDSVVFVTFEYKDIKSELKGAVGGGPYGSTGFNYAAQKVAAQVVQWVKDNATKLAAEPLSTAK